MSVLTRVLQYTKPYTKTLAFSLSMATLFGIASALPAYCIKHTIDEIFIKQYSHLIVPFILLFVGVFAFKGLTMYLSSYTMHWVNNQVINDLRADLFGKTMHLPLSFFQQQSTGALMTHFINDVQMIQQAATTTIKDGVRSFFEAIFLICFAVYQNYMLGILLVIIGPIIGVTINRLGKARKQASFSIQRQLGSIGALLQEIFVGIREIKAFNAENAEKKRFRDLLNHSFAAIMASAHVECLLPALVETLAVAGCSVIFYTAAHQVLAGTITAGQLTAFIAAVILAYQPLKKLVSVYSDIQYGLAAAERVFTILDIAVPATDSRPTQITGIKHELRFDHVSFSYDKHRVLTDVSLTINRGQAIGIVGPSGAGKSTLCDLLLAFSSPTAGQIYIDNQPISSISLESLRNTIGYVGQRTFLFNDTIANNVAYAQPDVTREQIIQACRAAHASGFIELLPNGYDSIVGENGTLLSGGQKQRITIARALLKNPDILIFDEATSSLDEASEIMIRQTIEALKGHKTLLIVSHRPSMLQNVDRILTVSNHTVSETASIASSRIPRNLDSADFSNLYNPQPAHPEPVEG